MPVIEFLPGSTRSRDLEVLRLTICLVVFMNTAWATQSLGGETGVHHFLYVSNRRVVALELIDKSEAILNYINLGRNYELLESNNLLILDSAGEGYRGHLLKREKADDEGQIFQVTELFAPREFRGYSVVGNFRFRAPPRSAYLRVGSQVLELAPLDPDEFERLADWIGKLNLETENATLALYDAGFQHGFGQVLSAGTPEASPISNLLEKNNVLPPVVLKNPAPRLLPKFSHLFDPVVVRIRLELTAMGGITNLSLEEGVDPELDQLAIEVVRNSWVLLPAVSEGKMIRSEMILRVLFSR